MEPSDTAWVPAFLFALLGCFFLQKSIRPGAKQSWSWGRGGGPVPVSRWGYASWAASFFAISVIVMHAPEPPMAAAAVFMACFLAMLAVGFIDTQRHEKARRHSDSRRDRAPTGVDGDV